MRRQSRRRRAAHDPSFAVTASAMTSNRDEMIAMEFEGDISVEIGSRDAHPDRQLAVLCCNSVFGVFTTVQSGQVPFGYRPWRRRLTIVGSCQIAADHALRASCILNCLLLTARARPPDRIHAQW